jgi:GT2 family glycosyltransferase
MVTWNRPGYTAMALDHLLNSEDSGLRVWVWHNGTDAETLNVVRSFEGHRNLHRVHHSPENKRLREPTNWFWSQSDAPYLGKVDDDSLVPRGWTSTLVDAHDRAPEAGLLACWHFYDDDFVPALAEPKIRELAPGCRVMRNCWVQGSGYVMKRAVVEQLGPLRDNETFSDYGVRAVLGGWTNGWLLPLIHLEHMDDPRSPHSRFSNEEDFQRARPLSAINHGVRTLEEWRSRARWMARSLQTAPYDPRLYSGWRPRVRRALGRLRRNGGREEPWRQQG